MHKSFLSLFLVVLLGMNQVNAQKQNSPVSPPAHIELSKPDAEGHRLSDTALVISSHSISPDSIISWKQSGKFEYMTRIDSLLRNENGAHTEGGNARERKVIGDDLYPGIDSQEQFRLSPTIRIILGTIAGVLVLILLFNLIKSRGIFIRSNNRKVATAIENGVEDWDFHSGNSGYPGLIKNAEEKGDFRMAIRYHFLLLLQTLADKELIKPARGKTNALYIREINQLYRADFSGLVKIYEHCWYGYMPVSADRYAEISNRFNQFQR